MSIRLLLCVVLVFVCSFSYGSRAMLGGNKCAAECVEKDQKIKINAREFNLTTADKVFFEKKLRELMLIEMGADIQKRKPFFTEKGWGLYTKYVDKANALITEMKKKEGYRSAYSTIFPGTQAYEGIDKDHIFFAAAGNINFADRDVGTDGYGMFQMRLTFVPDVAGVQKGFLIDMWETTAFVRWPEFSVSPYVP